MEFVWPRHWPLAINSLLTKHYHITNIPGAAGIQVYNSPGTRAEPNWFPIKKLDIGLQKLQLLTSICQPKNISNWEQCSHPQSDNWAVARLKEIIWLATLAKTCTGTPEHCKIDLTEAISLTSLHSGRTGNNPDALSSPATDQWMKNFSEHITGWGQAKGENSKHVKFSRVMLAPWKTERIQAAYIYVNMVIAWCS